MNCPKCRAPMEIVTYAEIVVDRCTKCRGLFFDALEPEKLKRAKGSEVIDVELQPLSVTWRLIREGAIDHALVVAAFAHLAALQAP